MGGSVTVEVGVCVGAVTATTTGAGSFVGVGAGAVGEALAGVVGTGSGVLVELGAGASAGPSTQATRTSKMIAETTNAASDLAPIAIPTIVFVLLGLVLLHSLCQSQC